jgi:signal recognition particle subunit SRP68
MSMREIHSAEKKGITGSTRSHIISRLHKAIVHATNLFECLKDQSQTKATDQDLLEARAYVASLSGALAFEKQAWEVCVKSYSEARIIYSALGTATKSVIFTDLISDPVDPSIRYGAYQMRLPRTVAIPTIVRKYFPNTDTNLVSQVEKLDPDVLIDRPSKAKSQSTESGTVPKTITWQSRTVDLEDAAIATALASVSSAAEKLAETLASVSALREKAAAYDDILIASQDTVDATKHAIDELTSEGVGQGDKRMQSLQITRTAVSYDMVSWRIGRNRVLVGEHDGALVNGIAHQKGKADISEREESTSKQLSRFREKAVLYDAILQSLESIKELPGVAADSSFLDDLDAKDGYFSALKYVSSPHAQNHQTNKRRCLTIARSQALLSNHKNALALIARASQKCDLSHTRLSTKMDTSTTKPPNISISPTEISFLKSLLDSEVQRFRALVELSNLTQASQSEVSQAPLVENLHVYPANGVVLENLVTYPPRLEPVPVKPLFFDAAWNYIEYPGREVDEKVAAVKGETPTSAASKAEQTAQQKKGWFGFGR